MPKQTRTNLKQYFLTGNTPTEEQFADLIDSALNAIDDPIVSDANGQVGIGTSAPTAKLEVAGTLKAASFSGDGAAVTNIQAANVAGFIPLAQIPDLPAEKITGMLDPSKLPSIPASQISGTLDASQLPPIPPAQIAGVLNAAQIPPIPAARIEGVLDVSQIPAIPGRQITGAFDLTQLPAIPAARIEGALDVSQIPAIPATQITGTLNVSQLPQIPASQITGAFDPAQLPSIPATRIEGALDVAQLPEIPAAQITGVLNAAQLPQIPATQITGALNASQIPAIPASQITGALNSSQVPPIPATQITGQLSTAQLPADQIPLLSSLLQRIRVLEGKAGLASEPPGLGFNGTSTHIVLEKSKPIRSTGRNITTNDGFTFQALVYPASAVGDLPLVAFCHGPEDPFNRYSLAGTSASFYLSIRDGLLHYAVMQFTSTGFVFNPVEFTTDQQIPPNTWTLITFVCTPEGIGLLSGGNIVYQQAFRNDWVGGQSMGWMFGRAGNSYFQGRMAAISIWAGPRQFPALLSSPARLATPPFDRAKLPELAREHYIEGLRGYWALDEGIGTVAHNPVNLATELIEPANQGRIIDPVWQGGR
jgi:hypothetical protein